MNSIDDCALVRFEIIRKQQDRIARLELENQKLRKKLEESQQKHDEKRTFNVPKELELYFQKSQDYLLHFFEQRTQASELGTIWVNKQRCTHEEQHDNWNSEFNQYVIYTSLDVMIRGAALTAELYQLMLGVFGTRTEIWLIQKDGQQEEALNITLNILFDLSYSIGKSDAEKFFEEMNLTDPISKLSAGPGNKQQKIMQMYCFSIYCLHWLGSASHSIRIYTRTWI